MKKTDRGADAVDATRPNRFVIELSDVDIVKLTRIASQERRTHQQQAGLIVEQWLATNGLQYATATIRPRSQPAVITADTAGQRYHPEAHHMHAALTGTPEVGVLSDEEINQIIGQRKSHADIPLLGIEDTLDADDEENEPS